SENKMGSVGCAAVVDSFKQRHESAISITLEVQKCDLNAVDFNALLGLLQFNESFEVDAERNTVLLHNGQANLKETTEAFAFKGRLRQPEFVFVNVDAPALVTLANVKCGIISRHHFTVMNALGVGSFATAFKVKDGTGECFALK